MLKILTAQIKEEIYYLLPCYGLFSDEQTGWRKGTKGIGNLLYIELYILNETKTTQKNEAMVLTEYKKRLMICFRKPG